MKKLKILQNNFLYIVKTLCVVIIFFMPILSFAQLPGLGVEINSGLQTNSPKINSFGIDASYEMGGAYFSVKNLFGVKKGTGIIQNESVNNNVKTHLIRHQLQVKYWFGNMIRARNIHPLRCAHLIKITEDHHFKPYLLLAIDNGLDLNKNSSNKYQFNGVTGIGANIRKFGNIYSAQFLFVELRSQFQINNLEQNNSNNPFSRIGIEGAVGIKFY